MSNSNPLKDSLVFQPIKVGDNTLSNKLFIVQPQDSELQKGMKNQHIVMSLWI